MLTNSEIIQELVDKNRIINYSKDRLEAASYDMVIGTIFKGGKIINASRPEGRVPINIAPGEVVTMLTLEEIDLPDNIAATAYAMNSQSSEGLLVLNPGHIDPGYKGPLTIVAVNLRKVTLPLLLGEPIFTVVFERLVQNCEPSYKHRVDQGRDYFERTTNKKVVEKSIESLKALLEISKRDIDDQIEKHWATKKADNMNTATFLVAFAALVFAVIAVIPK